MWKQCWQRLPLSGSIRTNGTPKVLENLQEVNKQIENNTQSLLKLSFSVSSPLLTATRAPCPRSEGDGHAGCSPATVRGTSTKAFRKRKPEKMLYKILPDNQKYKPYIKHQLIEQGDELVLLLWAYRGLTKPAPRPCWQGPPEGHLPAPSRRVVCF